MNKKIILLTCFSIMSICSIAQLNKNKWMLTGRGNYFKTSNSSVDVYGKKDLTKSMNGRISINAGYFISNSLALGATFGFGKITNSTQSDFSFGDKAINKSMSIDYFAGIFQRYNHVFGESKLGIFIQLDNRFAWGHNTSGYMYSPLNNTTITYSGAGKQQGYTAILTPGILYYITSWLSLEGGIGNLSYNFSKLYSSDPGYANRKESGFQATLSASTAYLGLSFYLGKKQNDTSENKKQE